MIPAVRKPNFSASSLLLGLASGVWRLATFLELDERPKEIFWMHESNPLAVGVALLLALAQHPRAFLREAGGRGGHVVHLQAEMVDAARGVALEKLRNRRIRARRLHQ